LYVSYAAAQLMKYGVNFRDPTRSVELFVISKQVIADKIACVYDYDVFSIGVEFLWS